MRVIQVEYSRTKQVKAYEPEKLTFTIELDEGESVDEAIRRARLTARIQFNEAPSKGELEEFRKFISEEAFQ